jgi:broad specificity phosphatase PhoE
LSVLRSPAPLANQPFSSSATPKRPTVAKTRNYPKPAALAPKPLANMLRDSKIGIICTTEFKRTQQTAAPLAKVLGLTVTTLPAENQAALVAKLRTSTATSLVVGHGNTIPDIIKALGIMEPVNIADSNYDNLFVIVLGEKPYLIRLHYR